VPTRPVGTVERALVAKGMKRDETHHAMFRKTIDGVTHLVTRTSHGAREINDGLAKLMGTSVVCSFANSGSSSIAR
jgi:hypothetical protein